MSYLVLQAEYKNGATLWREVWQGHDPVNAEHFGAEFARLKESPTVLLRLRDTGPDMFIPTILRKFDRQGYMRNSDDPGE